MLHVRDIRLVSNIWKKLKLLYQVNGLIERNTIFICIFTQILSDFEDITQFLNNIKQNSTWLQEIGIKDIPNRYYKILFLPSLSSVYNSFRLIPTKKKADQVGGTIKKPQIDIIFEQILRLDT